MRTGGCVLPRQIFSITKEVSDRSQIIIDCAIGVPSYLLLPNAPKDQMVRVPARALIDTGCSKTSISGCLASKCRLPPIAMVKVENAGGVSLVHVHIVDVVLDKLLFPSVSVAEFADNGKFDIIIGMDIIACGDMAITNANGRMVFSMRIPPDFRHIDYEKLGRKDKNAKNAQDRLRQMQSAI